MTIAELQSIRQVKCVEAIVLGRVIVFGRGKKNIGPRMNAHEREWLGRKNEVSRMGTSRLGGGECRFGEILRFEPNF